MYVSVVTLTAVVQCHRPKSADAANTATGESAATGDKPRPALTTQPARAHRRPAQYFEQVQAEWISRACTRCKSCRLASSDVAAVNRQSESESSAHACWLLSSECYRSDFNMPRSRIFRPERESSDSESSESVWNWYDHRPQCRLAYRAVGCSTGSAYGYG